MLVDQLLLNCDSSERNNRRRSFFVKFKISQSQNRNRQFDYLRPTYSLKHVGRVKLVDDAQVLGSVEIKDKCISQTVPFTWPPWEVLQDVVCIKIMWIYLMEKKFCFFFTVLLREKRSLIYSFFEGSKQETKMREMLHCPYICQLVLFYLYPVF
jgi:hypothetical protein